MPLYLSKVFKSLSERIVQHTPVIERVAIEFLPARKGVFKHLPQVFTVRFQHLGMPDKVVEGLARFPIAFEGHYYGRDGEELVPLNLEEIERIRAQATTEDWSAAVVPNASVDDLDEEAIALARKNFKNKFPEKAEEVDKWMTLHF